MDDLPLYIALNQFAIHLIGMLGRSDTESFPTIFSAIERLQLEGEHYVQEAMVVGLLEDLQNLNLHSTTQPEQFEPFFEPESRKVWAELYEFWYRVGMAEKAGLLEPQSGQSPQIDPDLIQDPELRRIVQTFYRKG